MIMVEYDRPAQTQHHHRPHHYQPPPPPPSHHQQQQQQQHRGSPHMQHMDHPSPHMTPSPTFSYSQPNMQPLLSQSRPGVTSYPSPSSHPSPSMSEYYPPPQPNSYRDSPTHSPAMLPSLSLPPIRLPPPPTSSPVPQHVQLGSPLPPPAPALPGYYQQVPPSMQHGHITSSPSQMPSRYPLPQVVGQERIMSGGRHKKEIKRRTKTGCLTCRKRRIKCDEAHPTCKNCQKSKRECLGYDPIFKPQPGPPPIQPAPSSIPQNIAPASNYPPPQPQMQHTSAPMMHHQQPPPPPPHHHHQQQHQQSPHHHLPHPHPHAHVQMGYGHPMSTTASSPGSVYDSFPESPYPVAIDPNLESATLPPPPHSPAVGERSLGDPNGYRPDLKRRLDRNSPFSSTSDTPRTGGSPIPRSVTPGASNYGQYRDDSSQPGNAAKRIKIDDLLTVAPPPPTPPPSENCYPNNTERVKFLYRTKYAPALDQLIETAWFGNQGLAQVLSNVTVAEVLSSIFDRLKTGEPALNGEEGMLKLKGGREGEILYCVMRLLYGIRASVKEDPDAEAEHKLNDLSAETYERVKVVKALVMGSYLDPTRRSKSPTPRSPTSNPDEEQEHRYAGHFWSFLRRFLEEKDSRSKNAEEALDMAKKFIGQKDSREVLFSIARARYLDAVLGYNAQNRLPIDPNESADLRDIRSYIEKTARSPVDAASCVFRRICGRAVAMWAGEVPATEE